MRSRALRHYRSATVPTSWLQNLRRSWGRLPRHLARTPLGGLAQGLGGADTGELLARACRRGGDGAFEVLPLAVAA